MLTIEVGFIAITILVIIILIIIFFTGENQKPPYTKEFYALGTINQLLVYGRKAEKAFKEAEQKLNEIDNKMSVFKDNSEVSKININAGREPQIVSKDTFYVIENAVKYCSLSEGAFDITIRPLVKLWGIGRAEARVPNLKEIKENLKLVNYKDVILNNSDNSVLLKNINQELDVGGIAKGFAADVVKNVLLRNKIKNALINLGGNIYALGSKEDGTPWCIGVQNPMKSRGKFIGTIKVCNKSVVTSGNYERYFMKDGKRFHHIINPKTGYPSEGDIISATIISNTSIEGDGLSTGVYILGIEKAMKLIEGIEGVDAIFITKDKRVHVTSGIKNNFTLTDNEFIYNN